MKLIVGLGNPGKQYQKTRHNFGFMVLDELHNFLITEQIGTWELSNKFNAEICGCNWHGEKIILVKPMTFMNESGISVQLLSHYYKIAPREIIVIHDDKDLKFGDYKVQINRGAAGHNGIKSIIDHIGSQEFWRVRLGIASDNPKKMQDISTFVLDKFGFIERRKAGEFSKTVLAEIEKLVRQK